MHPDNAGEFSFIIDHLMYVLTGMNFGSNTSAGSWEPFCRAMAILEQHYHSDVSLLTKHKDPLDVFK